MRFIIGIIVTILLLDYILCQDDEWIPKPKCIMNQNCFLPKCNCESINPPANLSHYRKDEIPQLVVLTIDDDGLDAQSYKIYKKLFENFKNPNNQSIKATFFLSDSRNETSFCLVRNMYEQMYEIAISTVKYKCPHKFCNVDGPSFKPWKYDTWIEQILNMRERLFDYAGIPKSEINGFRAPLLEPASDMHYRILQGNKFLYDSSLVLSSTENQKLMTWPFTLDYDITSTVNNNGPVDQYNGLWELPLPVYIGYDEKQLTCLKIWESWCGIDKSVYGISKFLRSHFLRSYYNKRAPVIMHINTNWLKEFEEVTELEILPNFGFNDARKRKVAHSRKEYRNLDGLIKFINITLQNNKDVYFVTAKQAIEWVRLMPTLEKKYVNLKEFVENEFLKNSELMNEDDDIDAEQAKFDGKCEYLKQTNPDFDVDQLKTLLDDTYGIKKEDQKSQKMNKTELQEFQSEVLFLNDIVVYLIVGLFVVTIFILIADQVFSLEANAK